MAWPLIAKVAAAVGGGIAVVLGIKALQKKHLQSVRSVTRDGKAIQLVVPASGTKPVNGVSTAANAVLITPSGASVLMPSSIKEIQSALNALGFGPLKVDGVAGPLTTKAVQQFQSAHGLTADGIIGDNVKKQLAMALSALAGVNTSVGQSPEVQSATAGSTPTIATCKDVQHALNLLGASPALQEDGVCGPKSIAAIKAFQVTHGLVSDGVAGPKTKAALAIALGAQQPIVHHGMADVAQAAADAAAAQAAQAHGDFGIGTVIPSQYPGDSSDGSDDAGGGGGDFGKVFG